MKNTLKKKEEISKPETTDDFVRVPVEEKKTGDKIKTIIISSKKGIRALYSTNRKKIVTYLFDRSKGWTMSKAKVWIKEHNKSEKKIIFNSMNKLARFNFEIPLLKARLVTLKNEKGEEIEERYIEGVASSTDKDLHGDKMASTAIESMAESLKKHVVTLNAEHDRSWQSELGEVTKFTVTDDYRLEMEAKLDKTSKSNDLWYALTEKKKKLGLSIGGFIKDFKIEVDEESGEWERTLTNIELDHVAVVSSPANPKTWVSVIAKSLNGIFKEDEKSSLNNNTNETMSKNLPLETEEKKETSVEEVSEEKSSVTPENGEENVSENSKTEETSEKEENDVEESVENKEEADNKKEDLSEANTKEKLDEKQKEESEEESEEKSDESIDNDSDDKSSDESNDESVDVSEEENKDESKDKTEEEPEKDETKEEDSNDEVKEDSVEDSKTIEDRVNLIEKSLDEVNKSIKSEEITKTLSTITDSVKEVLKSNEVLIKQNEELVKRVDALENQPAERKTVGVDKGLGSSNDVVTPEKTLEEALKEAEATYKNKSNLFAIKQRIRNSYAEMGIFE